MIQQFPSLSAISLAAAELFVDRAERAVRSAGRFSVALSGGSTPQSLYELLAQPRFRDRVPWEQVHVFWGDERLVPSNDPRSNSFMARTALLEHVPVRPEHIHPITPKGEPGEASADYERRLRTFFPSQLPRFDLVILGLGEDGHTASLFPHTSALEERTKWVAWVRRPNEPFARVTMTPRLLNESEMIVFLVSGESKARALHGVIEGSDEPVQFPARLIRPVNGDLLWLVDEQAASLLAVG